MNTKERVQKMQPTMEFLKWSARILALAFAGFIAFFAVVQGFNPVKFTPTELAFTVPFAMIWIGFLVGWRWQGTGAALIIGGEIGFYLLHYVTTGFGRLPQGWVFPSLVIPGLLFLAYSLRERRALKQAQAA